MCVLYSPLSYCGTIETGDCAALERFIKCFVLCSVVGCCWDDVATDGSEKVYKMLLLYSLVGCHGDDSSK